MKNTKLKALCETPYEKVETIEIQIADLKPVANRMNVQNILTSYMASHYNLKNQIYIYYYEDDDGKASVDIWVEEEHSERYCWELVKNDEKVYIDVYKFNGGDWQITETN